MAYLMRVPGIGGQWAELPSWRGVADASSLLARMNSVNTEEHRAQELRGECRVVH